MKPGPVSLFLLAVAGNLIAATVPFRLDLPEPVQNRLEVRPNGALKFREQSIAQTRRPPEWLDKAIRTDQLSIEITVTPASVQQAGPARILTISKNYYSHNLMIGQDRSDLVLRLRRPGAQTDGEPAFVVPAIFEARRSHDIRVRIKPERLRVEVDGTPSLDRRLPNHALKTWDPTFNLALGNEVVGLRPWSGLIERAAIATPGHREDLLASGSLRAPESWWQIPPRLRVPFEVSWPADGLAALLHFLAFLPIGYAASRLFTRRGSWPTSLLVVLGLAVGIEAVKVLVEGRHPTILNLLANACGGLIGMASLQKLMRAQPDE